jgi:hypothetical protein
MSTLNWWAMHRQSVWLERSATPSLPDWIRVAARAFACHKADGRAQFSAHDLSDFLGAPGGDGEWQRISAPQVSNAIKLAKKAGWIAEESNARCLVVPPHAVQGGRGMRNPRRRAKRGING